jgi:hypothetical protein
MSGVDYAICVLYPVNLIEQIGDQCAEQESAKYSKKYWNCHIPPQNFPKALLVYRTGGHTRNPEKGHAELIGQTLFSHLPRAGCVLNNGARKRIRLELAKPLVMRPLVDSNEVDTFSTREDKG